MLEYLFAPPSAKPDAASTTASFELSSLLRTPKALLSPRARPSPHSVRTSSPGTPPLQTPSARGAPLRSPRTPATLPTRARPGRRSGAGATGPARGGSQLLPGNGSSGRMAGRLHVAGMRFMPFGQDAATAGCTRGRATWEVALSIDGQSIVYHRDCCACLPLRGPTRGAPLSRRAWKPLDFLDTRLSGCWSLRNLPTECPFVASTWLGSVSTLGFSEKSLSY